MKAFWTLYFKELRSNKLLFLFLCIASLGIIYYFPLAIVSAKYSFYRDSFYFLSWSILFIIPLIMFSLVTFERKKDDNLLKLFLPIGRSTIILARFSAVTSMIVILPLGTRIFGNIFFYMFSRCFDNIYQVFSPFKGIDLLWYLKNFAIYLAPLILIAGIFSLLEAFVSVLKRSRLIFGFLFVFALFIVLIRLYIIYSWAFGIDSYYWENDWEWALEIRYIILYMYIMGIVFLGTGLFLYEKYAEA